jgi:hypothetical protein
MNLPDIKAQLFRQLGEKMELDKRGAINEMLCGCVGTRRRHCKFERLEQEDPWWNMRILLSWSDVMEEEGGFVFLKRRILHNTTLLLRGELKLWWGSTR